MQEGEVTERLLRLTMQHSPVGMCLVALDGGFITANTAICDMLGYTEAELRALDFAQITHPDDLEEDLRHVEDVLAGRVTTYRMRKRYLRRGGEPVWADLSVALLRDDDGEPIHISRVLARSTSPPPSAMLRRGSVVAINAHYNVASSGRWSTGRVTFNPVASVKHVRDTVYSTPLGASREYPSAVRPDVVPPPVCNERQRYDP